MRGFKLLVLAAAACLVAVAHAQEYPTKPVRVIVPFPPGGATETISRVVGQKLNDMWGQSIVVDFRGGAAGNLGADIVAKATPDGYTLLMASGSVVTVNQHLYKKTPFNPDRDLVAISNVASAPQVLVVYPNFPPGTIKELIALAKSTPGTILFGSAGIGSQAHLAAEKFAHTAGINVVHVPYKGGTLAMIDAVSGRIQFVTPSLAAVLSFIRQEGRLRALGVMSRQRVPQLPDVPAIAETLPGFENLGWFGLMAPAGTPKPIIEKIYRDVAKALAAADVRSRFEQQGLNPVGNRPAEFAKAIREESKEWAKIIHERNLVVE